MAELKPCPFCGGKPETVKVTSYGYEVYRVHCTNCHVTTRAVHIDMPDLVSGARYTAEEAKEKAEAIWNTRTPKERGGEK